MSNDVIDLKDFPKVIKGEHIELRYIEPTFENATALFKLIGENRDHLLPWMSWANTDMNKTPEEVFEYLKSNEKKWAEGTTLDFGIFLDGKRIGGRSAHCVSVNNKSFEVGSWLVKEATNKGYATEGLNLLLNEMFKFGFNRAVFQCDVNNERSAKLAARAGFKQEGLLRQNIWDKWQGKFKDTLTFSMLKSEFKKS